MRAEPIPYRRNQAFAAMLANESGLGTEGLTVVGGSALEIYTTGDYVSDDIDLLVEKRENVTRVLQSWGFERDGMYWRHPDLGAVVQIVGRYDSGSRSRNQIVSTRYGRVRLASIEDIIVKRLIEARWWRRPKALDEAMLAVQRFADRLDWEYMERVARTDRVDDLVADVRRGVSPREGSEPKNVHRA